MTMILGKSLGVIRSPRNFALDPFDADAYAIFGLARLLSGYVGPVIQGQRSSDSATVDFYPSQTYPFLWTSAGVDILTWAAGASVTGRLWYDQSLSGHDAPQTIAASQPRLVNAGVLDVGPNGRPVMTFDGAGDHLLLTNARDFTRNASALTIAAIVGTTNEASVPVVFGTSMSTGAQVLGTALTFGTGLAAYGARRAPATSYVGASMAKVAGLQRLIGRPLFAAGTIDVSVNGVTTSAALAGTAGPSENVANAGDPAIGRFFTGGQFLAGPMSAMILSRSALDVAELDTAMQSIMP